MRIRPAETRDRDAWLRMRQSLWPDSDNLEAGVAAYFTTPARSIVLLAEHEDGGPLGFAEVGIRAYAEGCTTSPVAFLEGWFVEPHLRGHGIGRTLVQAAERWARNEGLEEFASDTWLDNQQSIRAHLALGFDETERLVCFLKRL